MKCKTIVCVCNVLKRLGINLGQFFARRAEEVLKSMSEFRMAVSVNHGFGNGKIAHDRGCLKNQAQVQWIIKIFDEYYLTSANQYKALEVTQYIGKENK